MIGITSYGAYIPKLRLERMAIVQAMGWFAPAIMMVADGERSMCNWDEDAVTMAVAAARDCLTGMDKQQVQGLFLASTTLPFDDRQNAGIAHDQVEREREDRQGQGDEGPEQEKHRVEQKALPAEAAHERPDVQGLRLVQIDVNPGTDNRTVVVANTL